MVKKPARKWVLALVWATMLYLPARGQFLMDMIDTSKMLGRGMLDVYKRYDHLTIQGYIQPQYQFANSKGAGGNIFEGGPFPPNTNNRFRLRRGRIRFDYATFTKDNKPQLQFVFQFDGTEQGVAIRDFWGRLWENKYEMFLFTTGMFARPFGWEINLSSQDREAPERGRMSQTLMKTERDLGFMATYDNRKAKGIGRHLKVEAGVFNGQGLAGPIEFDSYKDFIGQAVLRSYKLNKSVRIGGGFSFLLGRIGQNNRMRYAFNAKDGLPAMVADSSHAIGSGAPRQYVGANLQLVVKGAKTSTQFRAEYWQGRQTALEFTSETPPIVTSEPLFVRRFNGGFFYLLQDIVSEKSQLVLKYDFYDPNTDVSEASIGAPGSRLGVADIKFSTIGIGALRHLNEHAKLTLMYNFVHNNGTQVPGFTSDVSDNILTCRLQFRF